MKLVKKLFAGSMLAAAVATSHAAIITPDAAGGSELFAVLYTIGNQNSLIVDLGQTIASFNTAAPQSFNLAASPYYSTFLSNNNGASPVQFAVIALEVGSFPDRIWTTAAANSTPANVINSDLGDRAANLIDYVTALNTSPNTATFTSVQNLTNGSSLDTTSNTITSFSTLAVNLGNSLNLVNAGSNAELWSYETNGPSNTATAIRTDFYSATETPSNLGAYFRLNQATGALDYFGEPTSVVNAIPEASEWAMMLSGLAMLGLMVRRRRNNV